VTRRGELTDEAWERIAPLLPENGRRGKQWKEHREVVNGILWRIRTGAPWRDLPSRYGPLRSDNFGPARYDHFLVHEPYHLLRQAREASVTKRASLLFRG
jgi:transposase